MPNTPKTKPARADAAAKTAAKTGATTGAAAKAKPSAPGAAGGQKRRAGAASQASDQTPLSKVAAQDGAPPAGGARSAAAVEAGLPQGGASDEGGQGLRMKAFVDELAARTGLKKAEVKPLAEAALTLLGDSLARGEGFNLPGLGKGKVVKTKPLTGGEVLTLKLKRGAEKNATSPLAATED